MPANFNALLRYKKIDECIRNRFRPCTIERMIDVCSEALNEIKGREKKVSRRTIMDDLKVMKSGDLGFWAPIEQTDGVYYYTDKDYSIFKQPLNEIGLLKEILFTLLDKRNGDPDEELDKLLLRIANITGDTISLEPGKQADKKVTESTPEQTSRKRIPKYKDLNKERYINEQLSINESEKIYDDWDISFNNKILPESDLISGIIPRENKKVHALMLWNDILKVI